MDCSGPTHGRGLIQPGLLARCAFPPAGSAVTCAVSGGADSLALLVLALEAGCRVTAVHVDHGLRVGSAAEAQVVAQAAERFGADFRAERVTIVPGPNLEARAREARYGVLPADVLTGHTADDRAETLLLNLLRGAGPGGLAGMARGARRPLLDLRRAETEAVCLVAGLEPVEDPSNRDPTFRRNRIRHELLPLLADIGDRDPVPVLVRQADLFAEIDVLLNAEAASIDPTSAQALRETAPAVARVAVRTWLLGSGVGNGYPVDAAAVERVLSVARGEAVATEVVGGWRVARSKGRIALTSGEPCKDAQHG